MVALIAVDLDGSLPRYGVVTEFTHWESLPLLSAIHHTASARRVPAVLKKLNIPASAWLTLDSLTVRDVVSELTKSNGTILLSTGDI